MTSADRPLFVLAWGRGWEDMIRRALERYQAEHGEAIELVFTSYMGGGDFFARMAEGGDYDLVIADREILKMYAEAGRLASLSESEKAAESLRGKFPSWLRPWFIQRGEVIYGVPLRWGLLGNLVRRSLLDSVAAADVLPDVGKLLRGADRTLLWSPNNYFLPPLVMLATAVRPESPSVLAENEFTSLRRLLEDVPVERITLASSMETMIEMVKNLEPDYVPCAGDWVIRSCGSDNDKVPEAIRREYQYVFPGVGRPLAFFEVAGVMASSPLRREAARLVHLLAAEDVRRGAEEFRPSQLSYVGNPSGADAKVLGPSYQEFYASELSSSAIPRDLPRDRLLRPRLDSWRQLWQEFVSEVGR